MTSLYIDGDLFVTEDGTLERFISGKDDGWKADAPDDALLRPAPDLHASWRAARTDRTGVVYVYDKPNDRVIAIDKANGDYKGQYRLAGSQPGWDDLRGMAVTTGIDAAPDDPDVALEGRRPAGRPGGGPGRRAGRDAGRRPRRRKPTKTPEADEEALTDPAP